LELIHDCDYNIGLNQWMYYANKMIRIQNSLLDSVEILFFKYILA